MLKGGGYGKVFLAENSITNELYAIKQIGIDKFSTEELYSISREKVYLSNLTHKNIIKYYTSFSFENNVYNVMDYAKGGELNIFIKMGLYLKVRQKIFLSKCMMLLDLCRVKIVFIEILNLIISCS